MKMKIHSDFLEVKKTMKYWMPDSQGRLVEYDTYGNSLVIIGANGSGKTHLGAWIERQRPSVVHRIGAQRALNFNDNIALLNYEQAEARVMWGTDKRDPQGNKYNRWGYNTKDYTTRIINDFENVLSALIAFRNKENEAFISSCKTAEQGGMQHPCVPHTVEDKFYEIWNELFPHRGIEIKDSKFYAKSNNEDIQTKYAASAMSDGERSVLYFSAQVLSVPSGTMLIIDEPELHLHKSLMNRLWLTLEKYRPDCMFVYFTHDTDFASSHSGAVKWWVKSYDGASHWELEQLEESELPENLLLELLGNRKPVLFVEGEKGSYDFQLYQLLYPSYYVVPCGSCSQVVARTKACKDNLLFKDYSVYGIIDRDYRSDYEIEKLKGVGVYCIGVAEVENLFITEEVIQVAADKMCKNPEETFQNVYDIVVNKRFSKQIQSQINKAVVAELKYKFATIELDATNFDATRESLANALESINSEAVYNNVSDAFKRVRDEGNYAEILRVFNEKGISKTIGSALGLQNSAYIDYILNNMRKGYQEFQMAMMNYLPSNEEIPIGKL